MSTQKLTFLEALKLTRLDTKQDQPSDGETSVADLSDDKDESNEAGGAPTDVEPSQDISAQSNDPDKQGMLRTVKGAHLVYKRQTEEGTFEELWVYKSDKLVNGLKLRRAILAGTDIPSGEYQSEDGAQTYELWCAGNIEMLLIKGLVQ